MSIFDQNNPKENSEELLYQTIKDELKEVLDKYDKKIGTPSTEIGIYFEDPERIKLIKDVSKLTLQFVWKKLGMKMPEYTRQILDKDFNILNYKEK